MNKFQGVFTILTHKLGKTSHNNKFSVSLESRDFNLSVIVFIKFNTSGLNQAERKTPVNYQVHLIFLVSCGLIKRLLKVEVAKAFYFIVNRGGKKKDVEAVRYSE